MCSVQQQLINGTLVNIYTQKDRGLVTIATGCSGTLVNRSWVLTADHCVTTNGLVGGPTVAMMNLAVTAAWTSRRAIPTRVVRNWGLTSGLDVALLFLGGGDLGAANTQLFYVETVETNQTIIKSRPRALRVRDGDGPDNGRPGATDRWSVSKRAIHADRCWRELHHRATQRSGADCLRRRQRGPDFVITPDGIHFGIAGV